MQHKPLKKGPRLGPTLEKRSTKPWWPMPVGSAPSCWGVVFAFCFGIVSFLTQHTRYLSSEEHPEIFTFLVGQEPVMSQSFFEGVRDNHTLRLSSSQRIGVGQQLDSAPLQDTPDLISVGLLDFQNLRKNFYMKLTAANLMLSKEEAS